MEECSLVGGMWEGGVVARSRKLLSLRDLLSDGCDKEDLTRFLGPCVASLIVPEHQPIAYTIIGDILEKCSGVHELDQSSVTSHFLDLATSLKKCNVPAHIPALKCIEILLHRYPKASGAHKNIIEKFLVQFLDSNDKTSVVFAAKCAHLLQQVRGGGELGTNHKAAWVANLTLLLQAAATVLEQLYSEQMHGEHDQDSVTDGVNQSPMQAVLSNATNVSVSSDKQEAEGNPVVLKARALNTRLCNILVFVQAVLVEPFPVSKRINCGNVFALLLRCLSAACGPPSPAKGEPLLHRAIMDTNRAMILCLRGDILPYSSLIIRMVLQTLDWSKKENDTAGVKPHREVRKTAYNCLRSLLMSAQTLKPPQQQGESSIEDRLLLHILVDVLPHNSSLHLVTMINSGAKGQSKKARRKIAQAVNNQGLPGHPSHHSQRSPWLLENQDLTLSAVRCLTVLFQVCGTFFKADTHKSVQEKLVPLLYGRGVPPVVQGALGEALLAAQGGPCPLTHSIQLLSQQQNSQNLELSWLSSQMLRRQLSTLRGAPPLLPAATPVTASPGNNVRASKALRLLAAKETSDDLVEVMSSSDEEENKEEEQIENSKKRKRSGDNLMPKIKKHNLAKTPTTTPVGKRHKTSEPAQDKPYVIDLSDSDEKTINDQVLKTVVLDENASDDDCLTHEPEENITTVENGVADVEICTATESNEIVSNNVKINGHADSIATDKNYTKDGGSPLIDVESVTRDDTCIRSNESDEDFVRELDSTQKLCNDTYVSVGCDDSSKGLDDAEEVESEKNGKVSVEEMLGSFVDEVKEDMQ